MAIVVLLGLLIISAACRQKEDSGKLKIAVSTPALGRIVQEITGKDAEIITLLPAGCEPETFEPDMAAMKKVNEADVFLTLNTIGFEQTLSDKLKVSVPDLKIIDISGGIERIMDTHNSLDGHDHSFTGDPHLLSSPRNAVIILENTRRELTALQPGSTEKFRKSSTEFANRLENIQSQIDSIISGGNGEKYAFVVTHPSLSYYSREFDMEQISLERDGKEVTPRQLEERLAEADLANPRVMIYEKSHSPERIIQIAKELGIKVFPVDFNANDFPEQYIPLTKAITDK